MRRRANATSPAVRIRTPAKPRKRPSGAAPETPRDTPGGARADAPDHVEPLDPAHPPASPEALHHLLRTRMGIIVARAALLPYSLAPFDYLVHAFFEGRFAPNGALRAEPDVPPADAVVWANRGGGKTFLGALATLLDLVFKPGIEVRILGGSLEQSRRMADHLQRLCTLPAVAGRVRRATGRGVWMTSGAHASVLTHSQTSVRGTRVQKVRCDEVELFDRDIWDAAQMTTRSMPLPGPWGRVVRGGIEALSTMHRPMGLMWDIVAEAQRARPARVLFRWGAIDVLERCGPEHACDGCALHGPCAGRAKDPARVPGHLHVADALAHKARISTHAWESEMLCERPTRGGTVLPEFDQRVHVYGRADDAYAPASALDATRLVVAGMDFGYRAPTVIVWGEVSPDHVLRITHEHVQAERRLEDHIAELSAAGRPRALWVAVDPAGGQRNDQTGASNILMLRRAGWVVKSRRAGIHEGLELVRRRLEGTPLQHGRPGQPGTLDRTSPGLLIHARCTHLITAMHRYRYDEARPESLTPVKDGHDHAVDALRYLIVALDAISPARHGSYTGAPACRP